LESDLVLSYWTRSTERWEDVLFVEGHTDGSTYLIGLEPKKERLGLMKRLLTFKTPFSDGLWILFILFGLLCGVLQYILELPWGKSWERPPLHAQAKQASLAAYNSVGTFLGVSGLEPTTLPGRIVVAFTGFFFIIFGAAYTANLASILNQRTQPVFLFRSIGELVSQDGTVASTAAARELLPLYPSLRISPARSGGPWNTARELKHGKLDGWISSHASWRSAQADGATCGLALIGQPIRPDVLGFAVSKQSPCVLGAMSFAIKQMLLSGEIAQFEKKWFRKPGCGAPSSSELTADSELTLTVEDMAGVFMLTVAGCAVSFVIKLAGVILAPLAKPVSPAIPAEDHIVLQELAKVKGLLQTLCTQRVSECALESTLIQCSGEK
jgi:hypothetical protein